MGFGGWKFVQMVQVMWPRWLRPWYMIKVFKILQRQTANDMYINILMVMKYDTPLSVLIHISRWCPRWLPHIIWIRIINSYMYKTKVGRVKRIWYLSPMRAAKVQASLRICAVSPEPPLLAHTSSESRGIFRQKARSLAPLNGWACAVKICHDGMLEDTNSLDAVQVI